MTRRRASDHDRGGNGAGRAGSGRVSGPDTFDARYEFKYLLDAEQLEWVRDRASVLLEPDRFGDNGAYTVTSLYFDTWDWRMAYEALEGMRSRLKLRIRTYGRQPVGPLWLEVKRREGTSILKSRAKVSLDEARRAARGEALEHAGDAGVVAFENLRDRLDMTPRLWVRYHRQAWFSPFGDGARLTFDSRLEVLIPDDEDPMRVPAEGWRHVPMAPAALLELKFNNASPAWMQRVVLGARLTRESFSKYTQGAILVGDLPWARRERGRPWTP